MHVLQLPEKRLEGGKNGRRETFTEACKDVASSPHPISQLLCIPGWLGQNPGRLQAGESVHARQEWTSPQGLQQDSVLVAHGGNWLSNTPLSGCLPFPVSPPHSLAGAFLNPLLNKQLALTSLSHSVLLGEHR